MKKILSILIFALIGHFSWAQNYTPQESNKRSIYLMPVRVDSVASSAYKRVITRYLSGAYGTMVSASTYTTNGEERVMVSRTSNTTITLGSKDCVQGKAIIIQDIAGTRGISNYIQIASSSGNIDGNAYKRIETGGAGVTLNYDGTNWNTTNTGNSLDGEVLLVHDGTMRGHTTMAMAIAAATSGDVIVLQDDIVISSTITLPSGVSINGNGKTITMPISGTGIEITAGNCNIFNVKKLLGTAGTDAQNSSHTIYAHGSTVVSTIQIDEIALGKSPILNAGDDAQVFLNVKKIDLGTDNQHSLYSWRKIFVADGAFVKLYGATITGGTGTSSFGSVVHSSGSSFSDRSVLEVEACWIDVGCGAFIVERGGELRATSLNVKTALDRAVFGSHYGESGQPYGVMIFKDSKFFSGSTKASDPTANSCLWTLGGIWYCEFHGTNEFNDGGATSYTMVDGSGSGTYDWKNYGKLYVNKAANISLFDPAYNVDVIWPEIPSAGGSVISVGVSVPTGFGVTGSPVTTSGTIAITTSLSGIVKGTGSGLTAATSGTDFVAGGTGTANQHTKFTASGVINNSIASDDGSKMTVAGAADALLVTSTGSGVTQQLEQTSNNDVLFRLKRNGGSYWDSRYYYTGEALKFRYNDADRFTLNSDGSASLSGALTLGSALGVASGGTGATSFTAGRVLFGNGTSALNTSANLFWDNTNNRLGIGIAPTSAVHVVGTDKIAVGTPDVSSSAGVAITNSEIRFRNSSNYYTALRDFGYALGAWDLNSNILADLKARVLYATEFRNNNNYSVFSLGTVGQVTIGNTGGGYSDVPLKLVASGSASNYHTFQVVNQAQSANQLLFTKGGKLVVGSNAGDSTALVNIQGTQKVSGIATFSNTTASTSTTTGSATFGGGIGVAGRASLASAVINTTLSVNGLAAGATTDTTVVINAGVLKKVKMPSVSITTTGAASDSLVVINAGVLKKVVATSALTTTGVTAGAFGSASAAPIITVGTDGRITSISTVSITASTTVSLYVRPETHGAVGNGSTDDATAFQTAINTCTSGCVILLSSSKNYRINTMLTVLDNMIFMSDGGNATITSGISGVAHTFYVNNKDNVHFRDINFTLSGSPSNTNVAGHILFNRSKYSSVRNCTFTKSHWFDIQIKGEAAENSENIIIDGNKSLQLAAEGGSGNSPCSITVWGYARNITITNNQSLGVGAMGIAVQNFGGTGTINYVYVAGNTIRDKDTYGIMAYDANADRSVVDIQIVNNHVENINGVNGVTGNAGAGIYLASCFDCLVQGNYVKNSNFGTTGNSLAPGGIGINDADNCIISDNKIVECDYHGITVRNTDGFTLTGNNIMSPRYMAIEVWNSSNGTITGNRMSSASNTEQMYYLKGSSDIVFSGNIVNCIGNYRLVDFDGSTANYRCVISNNNFNYTGTSNVLMLGSTGTNDYFTIKGNIFRNNTSNGTKRGVSFTSMTNSDIEGNSFLCASGQDAVLTSGTCTGTTYRDNKVLGNVTIDTGTAGLVFTLRGTAAPTAAGYAVGSRVYNSAPSGSGSAYGWIYTSGGTWRTISTL